MNASSLQIYSSTGHFIKVRYIAQSASDASAQIDTSASYVDKFTEYTVKRPFKRKSKKIYKRSNMKQRVITL
jgi:hypothetical protein